MNNENVTDLSCSNLLKSTVPNTARGRYFQKRWLFLCKSGILEYLVNRERKHLEIENTFMNFKELTGIEENTVKHDKYIKGYNYPSKVSMAKYDSSINKILKELSLPRIFFSYIRDYLLLDKLIEQIPQSAYDLIDIWLVDDIAYSKKLSKSHYQYYSKEDVLDLLSIAIDGWYQIPRKETSVRELTNIVKKFIRFRDSCENNKFKDNSDDDIDLSIVKAIFPVYKLNSEKDPLEGLIVDVFGCEYASGSTIIEIELNERKFINKVKKRIENLKKRYPVLLNMYPNIK